MPSGFQDVGDDILAIWGGVDSALDARDLGPTEFAKMAFGTLWGTVPELDLQASRRINDLLVSLASKGLVKSATDEGSGGIAVALAKSALINGIGARFAVTVEQPDPLERALLFYEANGSVYLSTSPSNTQRVIELAKEAGVVCSHIGHDGARRLAK